KVDVDELGRENVRDERRGLGHCRWIGAKHLHADRTFVLTKAELADGRFVLAANSFGRQKLGDDHIRSKAAAEAAERRFRHACHWRQIQWDVHRKWKRKAFHSF